MSDTYTHKVGIRQPEDNKTNWGNDYREEFADLVDLVLANIIDGNGVLAGGEITAGAGALQASIAAGKALVGGSLYEWSAAADQSLTDDDINYVYINSSGSVTVSATVPTGNFAFLGRVPCESGARVHIKNFPNQLFANLLRTAGADLKLNAHLGTDGTAADAGVSVERGVTGADAEIKWNETDDEWEAGVSGALARIARLLGASHTLRHEEGGLEADLSAYQGVPRISGGSTNLWQVCTEQITVTFTNGNVNSDVGTLTWQFTFGTTPRIIGVMGPRTNITSEESGGGIMVASVSTTGASVYYYLGNGGVASGDETATLTFIAVTPVE